MDMKRISCAVIVAAATVSAAMAAEVPAPAPAPTSGAADTLPVIGSLIGASVVSFFAYFL